MMLAKRIGTRCAIFMASMLAATIVVFAICNALPGDLAQVILGENADPNSVAQLRQRLGLSRPWIIRYTEWLAGLLRGDLGSSYLTGNSVADLIMPKLAVTLQLVIFAMVLALLIALPLGMYSAVKRRHWQGFIASSLTQTGMAVPAFLAGILSVYIFAVILRLLPANGYVQFDQDPAQWLRHLILPVASLAVVQSSVLVRYVRSATIEVLNEDYFRTARSVGWGLWSALLRHGLRNAALNVVTVLGLQLATLLVGAIVVESVFQLPGLGQQLLLAVSRRDLGLVQGLVLVLVAAVLLINALVDVLYAILDPRLRTTTGTIR